MAIISAGDLILNDSEPADIVDKHVFHQKLLPYSAQQGILVR